MAARTKGYRPSPDAAPSGDTARVTVSGIIAVSVDTILNAGGMWAVVMNLNNTDSYTMFAKSLDFSHSLSDPAAGTGEMRMLPALGIALALGYVLSIAPHKLWHRSGFGDAQQTRRRIASVVAAIGGWYTTWLFVQVVAGGGVVQLVVSLLIEWLLFEFKREVLR